MDDTILAIIMMLVTWWVMFRAARWLGGWGDGEKK